MPEDHGGESTIELRNVSFSMKHGLRILCAHYKAATLENFRNAKNGAMRAIAANIGCIPFNSTLADAKAKAEGIPIVITYFQSNRDGNARWAWVRALYWLDH